MKSFDDRIVVGLDIGTTKVVAVVGKYNEHGSIDILGMGTAPSEGVERGSIVYIEKTVQAIKTAVEKAEEQSRVEIQVVTVGVSGEHIVAQQETSINTMHEPDHEISEEDVDSLCRQLYGIKTPEGKEILHVIPQEFAVDSKRGIKDPIGMSGVRLEGTFHVVMCNTNHLRAVRRVIERAGLELDGIVLESLASSYATLIPEEMSEGVAVVDIGGGTTDLAIFEDNILRHTAVIPFGGNIITSDIRQGCKVMKKQAEELKRSFGSAMADALEGEEIISIAHIPNHPPREISRRTLAMVVQARMEEIAEMASAEIRRAGMEKNLVGGIVITGGGSNLAHTRQLFEFVTGQTCRIGLPTTKLSKGLVEEVNNPVYATATGLVVYNLETDLGHSPEYFETARRKHRRTEPKNAGSSFLGSIKTFFEKAIDNSPIE